MGSSERLTHWSSWLSQGTTIVAHFRNVDAADHFYWFDMPESGDTKLHTEAAKNDWVRTDEWCTRPSRVFSAAVALSANDQGD
ncbi:DUF6461 domain-containing protein [Streptomyces sp. bgisy095]|uniref:DUF6461 domain-containing protein n=1 Tax=unclassified Streptomyces TaxID=2593676 RepID=UPI003D7192F3